MTNLINLFFVLFSLSLKSAKGNIVGNDTQRFNPTTSGLDFVTAHSSEVLEKGYLNSGIFFNQASDVLPDSTDLNSNPISSNNSVFFSDISFGYGLGHQLEAGLSISYLVDQNTSEDLAGSQFAEVGLNEIRMILKYQLLKRAPIGMAVVGTINLNQVKNNPFTGQGSGPTKNVEIVFDKSIGPTMMALNFGYRSRDRGSPISGALFEPLHDSIIGSYAVSYYSGKYDVKLIGEILSVLDSLKSGQEGGSEMLLGFKYDWTRLTSIHSGIGLKLSEGAFNPDNRIYAGINFSFDALAALNQKPIPTEPSKDEKHPRNNIHLNIYNGFQPQEIEAMAGIDFNELKRKFEFQLSKFIPSSDSQSPKPPFEIIRLDGFEFDFGSSKIKPEHHEMLNSLARYLKSDPKVIKLRIEGHTDSLGSEGRNKSRSQSRADQIKLYLEKQNVKVDFPIEALGYGSDQPIADNSNAQDRAKNRRVEVRVLRRIPSN